MNLVAYVFALIGCTLGWGVLLTAGRSLLEDNDRRVLLIGWYVTTTALFFMPTGLTFLAIAGVILIAMRGAGVPPVVLFVFMLSCVPAGGVSLEELPFNVNYLFNFRYVVLLALVVLLPFVFSVGGGPRRRVGYDVLFGVLVLLLIVLSSRGASFTSFLRNVFEWTVFAVLPYLAITRGVTDVPTLRRTTGALLASLALIGVIGFYTAVINWNVYMLPEARLFDVKQFGSLRRIGLLRTGSTLGGVPISFGTMMVVGMGLAAGFSRSLTPKWRLAIVGGACFLGLLGSVSRGPMVGMLVAILAFQLTRPNPLGAIVKTGAAGTALALPALFLTDMGRGLVALLPFIGDDQQGSVTYRQELAEAGMAVIARKPLFGSLEFKAEPEMLAMIQGQGIIDVVNTYLFWALNYGLVTTGLIVILMLSLMNRLFKTSRSLSADDPDSDALRLLGGGLLAGLVGYAFTIATTSLTGVLDSLLWILLALGVAYVRSVEAWRDARSVPSFGLDRQAETQPHGEAIAAEDVQTAPPVGPQAAAAPSKLTRTASIGAQGATDLDVDAILRGGS